MENQPKVSLSHQKEVITSFFNVLFFNNHQSPPFEKIDGKELAVLSSKFKDYEAMTEKEFIDHYLEQFHKQIPKEIRHQAYLMLISRPAYQAEIILHLGFQLQENKIEQENFKVLESMILHRPTHRIVIAFIGGILYLEEGFKTYGYEYIGKTWYDSIIQEKLKDYADSFNLF